jgi:outer membrane protein
MIRARALVMCASGAFASFAPTVARAQESPTLGPASRLVTLTQLERTAVTQHPQTVIARAQTSAAEAVADQARAPMLPQVTGAAQYTRQTGNYVARPGAIPGGGLTGAPSPSLTTSYDYWSFGVSATQLVYDFGQQSSRYHAAETSAEAQRMNEEVIRLQLIFGVRRAYFAARAAKDLVGVARDTLDDQNKHLQQVDGFVRAGTQPPIALAQQRAAVANAQVLLITAQNAYETAKAQLNQAAGLTGGTDYDVGDEVLGTVDGEDLPRDALVARAIAARPELANLVKLRKAQE